MLQNLRISIHIQTGAIGGNLILTSNSVTNLGKVEPTMAWGSWVPGFLNWNTLHYNSNAGEKRNNSSDCKTSQDDHLLDSTPHNSKKKYAHSGFANANDHYSRYLAE